MSLSSKEVAQLKRIVRLAEELINKAGKTEKAKPAVRRTRPARRSGEALVAFREKLKAERQAGVPVAKIAKKHRVSPAYVYQLGNPAKLAA